MEIKILCPCGSKYKFDVEPLNGKMPGPVRCPVCAADGTEAGNQLIAEALASSRSVLAPVAAAASSTPAGGPVIAIPKTSSSSAPAISIPRPAAPAAPVRVTGPATASAPVAPPVRVASPAGQPGQAPPTPGNPPVLKPTGGPSKLSISAMNATAPDSGTPPSPPRS